MEKIHLTEAAGESFEDLTITEMTLVQGSGDVSPETTTTPICAVAATFAFSVGVAKTIKGHC